MTHTLTDDFSVTDYQATPSGYYQLSFRSREGQVVTVTQEGRGGCNIYTPRSGDFYNWLNANAGVAIAFYRSVSVEWAAHAIEEREVEWEDHVVMAIADMVEMRLLSVKG